MTRLIRASWNWWTALAIVAVFAVVIGAQFKVPTTSISDSVERVSLAKGAPMLARGSQAESAANSVAAKLGASDISAGPPAAVRSVLYNRQIARKAFVSLIVPDVEHALAALSTLTHRAGGDITKLDDEQPSSANEQHAADATAIVPQRELDSVLKQITQLGGLRSETVSAEDLTDQLVDEGARLRNLRRTESDTLKIMDRSGRIGEVLEVENQLSEIRDQIEKLDAEAHASAARVATSTIDVHFEDAVAIAVAAPSVATVLGNAWRGAWEGSRDAAISLIARSFYLIAFAPYCLVPLAVIGFIVNRTRRRLLAVRS